MRLIGTKFGEAETKMYPFQVNQAPSDRLIIKVDHMGKDKELFPEQICAMVLTKLRDLAEAYLSSPMTNVVITVPTSFSISRRQAIKVAGSIAGLSVDRVVTSSTSAALGYVFELKASGEKTVLIIDLGGGTVDVSLIVIENGIIKVIATGGDAHLGGVDFTDRLVKHFVKEFKIKKNRDISGDPRAMAMLKKASEKAKTTLSSTDYVDIQIDSLVEGIGFETRITRKKFESLCNDFFKKCMELLKKCLRDACMPKKNVDEILAVRGFSMIPKVQEMVQEVFNEIYRLKATV